MREPTTLRSPRANRLSPMSRCHRQLPLPRRCGQLQLARRIRWCNPSKVIAIDVAEAGDGVQWAGEYDALAGRREKGAFVSQLAALGYVPNEFRVTVRRVSSDGPGDSRQRYTVLVAQLRNGAPYRGKRYDGGHGADWIDQFAREAATDFPRNASPIAPSGEAQRAKRH